MSIAVIHRWRLHPGMEARFAEVWAARTQAIHDACGSYGARLHRGEDGLWVSYARWPSEAARRACDAGPTGLEDMRACITESYEEIVTELVEDRLAEPGSFAPEAAVPALDAGGGVRLEPLDPARDAPALHAIFGDPASTRFLPGPPCSDVAATEARLRSWAGADSPQWIIARQGSAALGRITLVETRRGVAEIGVMVVPAAQRRGLALQAVCAVTAWALSEGGRVRVFADLDPDNVASERLFRRAGYGFEARQTATWVTHTGVADSLVFAATRGWQAPDPTRATAAPPTGCSA